MSREQIPISETFSSNKLYSIISSSYDDEFPNLKGESIVYKNGQIIYKIPRSFDLYHGSQYFLAISNDGKTVYYFTNDILYKGAEFNNITIYKEGKFVGGYSTKEFTGCDKDNEKCALFYNNDNKVIDYNRSNLNVINYLKLYKENIPEREKYLNENYVFNLNDSIYLTDSRKLVTIFDLKNGKIVSQTPFDSIYHQIKNFQRKESNITYYNKSYKRLVEFQTTDGDKLYKAIEKISGYRHIDLYDPTYRKYKLHRFHLSGYLRRDGKFEIENVNCDSALQKQEITKYVTQAVFDADFLPRQTEKQYFSFVGGYRNPNDSIAELETIREKIKIEADFKLRMTLDSIDHIYIPKNLKECIIQLDSILNFDSKKSLKESTSLLFFNSHLGGLGMWIRNNWGINGGSRLLKYFNDRGFNASKRQVNDLISGIIIENYILWLKGDKEPWKEWEQKNPIK